MAADFVATVQDSLHTEDVGTESFVLSGRHVRLEPLDHCHVDGLVAASAADQALGSLSPRDLYRWSPVPQNRDEAIRYVDTAIEWLQAGTAVSFATVRASDGVVIGSTRFFNLERWAWPPGHSLHGRSTPDACEIGYTWLSRAAIRTAANTEAKLLMLTHAFETWNVLRVCLHADARNDRSRAAIERIGGKFEGILRAHRMAADFIARDSARYSIISAEWPVVKGRLSRLLGDAGYERNNLQSTSQDNP
jgi:RimJ/RimL family protein N-acetyltransferase